MGLPEPNWAEKRTHERFDIDDYSVVVYKVGVLQKILFSKKNIGKFVTNISMGGACLQLERRVERGARVRMLLIFNKFNDVFEADGEVRWITSLKGKHERYEVGVQFLRVDPLHARKLESAKSWFTSDAFRMQKGTARRMKSDRGGVQA